MGVVFYIESDMDSEEEVEVHEFTSNGEWDAHKLPTKISIEIVDYILESIKPPSNEYQTNVPWWMSSKRGNFSVN